MKPALTLLSGLVIPAAMAAGMRPGAPVDLTATPDPTGLLKATVSFKAPTLTSEETPLEKIDRMELRRGSSVVKVFDAVTPGEEYEYTDLELQNGYTSYSVSAYAEGVEGDKAESGSIFVGVDVPLPPKQLKTRAYDNRISFTWPKSDKKGENGERVRQEGVSYLLELLDDSYNPVKTLNDSKGQTFDHYRPCDSGAQDLVRFGIRAYNRAGYSRYLYTRVVVGAPYTLPYSESFGGGVPRSMSWQEGDGYFGAVTYESADNDAGAMLCEPSGDDLPTSYNLGKISLVSTKHPRMSFQIKDLPEGEKILLRVLRPDGAEATLATIEGPVDEWTPYTVDLSPLRNERYFIPKFRLEAGNKGSVLIDAILVEDPYDHDLALDIEAPEKGFGKTPVTLTVTNTGIEKVERFTVGIYSDGVPTDRITCTESIEPGGKMILSGSAMVSGKESVEVKGILEYIFDRNPANDTASAQIIPDESLLPEISSVSSIDAVSDETEIYTVDGRLILSRDASALTPGVYIVNGRKVIIKN